MTKPFLSEKFLRNYTPKFQKELKELEPHLLKDEIEPRKLQRFWTVFNKAIEKYHKVKPPYDRYRNFDNDYEIPSEYDMIRSPSDFIKDINKCLKDDEFDNIQKSYMREYKTIAQDISPVWKILKKLDNRKIKNTKEYQISQKNSQIIKDAVLKDKEFDTLIQNLRKSYTKKIRIVLNDFLKNQNQSSTNYWNYVQTLRTLIKRKKNGEYQKISNFKVEFTKFVNDQVDNFVSDFVRKQMYKIGPLLDANKRKFKLTVDLISGDGFPEGWVNVEYKDRSFRTLTQIVYGVSEHGYNFVRYPTTFHNIVKKGKLIAKKQSQEWMMEEFHK